MSYIGDCTRCTNKAVRVGDDGLCDGCYAEQKASDNAETQCPSCGTTGVTSVGVCYACENSIDPRDKGVMAGLNGDNECPYASDTENARRWREGYNGIQTAMREVDSELSQLC
ncbi:hypothetical protein ACIPL1_27795 [Pseudomonas sp. NPDC090202]|uniref:hypothetical protein n=1 Tax=Pseudomonas sp. NPDC090202 TaxID=3364476 RepID=UPI0037FD814C